MSEKKASPANTPTVERTASLSPIGEQPENPATSPQQNDGTSTPALNGQVGPTVKESPISPAAQSVLDMEMAREFLNKQKELEAETHYMRIRITQAVATNHNLQEEIKALNDLLRLYKEDLALAKSDREKALSDNQTLQSELEAAITELKVTSEEVMQTKAELKRVYVLLAKAIEKASEREGEKRTPEGQTSLTPESVDHPQSTEDKEFGSSVDTVHDLGSSMTFVYSDSSTSIFAPMQNVGSDRGEWKDSKISAFKLGAETESTMKLLDDAAKSSSDMERLLESVQMRTHANGDTSTHAIGDTNSPAVNLPSQAPHVSDLVQVQTLQSSRSRPVSAINLPSQAPHVSDLVQVQTLQTSRSRPVSALNLESQAPDVSDLVQPLQMSRSLPSPKPPLLTKNLQTERITLEQALQRGVSLEQIRSQESRKREQDKTKTQEKAGADESDKNRDMHTLLWPPQNHGLYNSNYPVTAPSTPRKGAMHGRMQQQSPSTGRNVNASPSTGPSVHASSSMGHSVTASPNGALRRPNTPTGPNAQLPSSPSTPRVRFTTSLHC